MAHGDSPRVPFFYIFAVSNTKGYSTRPQGILLECPLLLI
jgi:hypothetical protein